MLEKKYKMVASIALIVAVLYVSIIYLRRIELNVVDAETGIPLEGAVVLVEWTIKIGPPGLTNTKTYKRIEKITSKRGNIRVFGLLNPFINPPLVVIYKKGYVAWRSDLVFPDYLKREKIYLKHELVSLERFKRDYLHSMHILFIHGDLSLSSSSKLDQAYSWELPLARKEEELFRMKFAAKKKLKCSEKEIWKDVLDELYFPIGEK